MPYQIRRWRSRPLVPPRLSQIGDVTFTPSPDHQSVTDYSANVYASGTSTPVVATQDIGHPTPIDNVITVNMAATLNALAAGIYDVTIVTTSPSGSTESGVSNTFTVPLVAP